MILSEYLKKSNIIIGSQSKTRWDLIQEMLDLAVKNRDVKDEDREAVKKALFEREKSMSTGIGKGVAIPHCTSDRVEDIIIVLALCENGIDFDAIDNQPVKISILLLVAKNKLTQHIKTLANIARIMNNDAIRDELILQKTADTVLKTIKKYEAAKK
ncbi:MAG TPA: PTS sugar transporter subunit IIA [Spirochaetota bacterium]|jgi:PTS system fructose-specific IIA component|nr:PTS sugar transporter subunit IIA [Spirochaetota bacterium]OPZ39543.1 MAG: PTS system fructose-specific EIIABC component [Spirochaetes bacterium ADurb.BinA120]HNU91107.1 PTS sugar transporter subunit IIA [Spirochaetota bacterium]HPI14123.1 PTS sugar transporter subunit IIA [Spirochaetota bacterium]HPO45164.1 PTS sugar transporter subunit IIA [Spirochaetota bacterium]